MTENELHGLEPAPGQSLGRMVRAAIGASANKLADFMLPPLRLACRTPVQAHDGICAECWNDIEFIEPPRCDRLGIQLPYPSRERIVSAAALSDPAIYDRARAVARYDGVMCELIHGFKYGDHHAAVRLFSRWLLHAGATYWRMPNSWCRCLSRE
jgi:predicted amidophosphoribosyltransferase